MTGKCADPEGLIILFHPEGEDYLKTMVLQGLNYQVFDPLKDIKYNVWAVVQTVYRFLKFSHGLHFKDLWSLRRLKILLRKARAVHVADQLRGLKPKVVLTFIDNSNLFHLVCEAYKETPFLAIQNGGRYMWCATEALPDPELKYCIDEYYCFGPYVQNLFEKHGHYKINKYITCGSLIGGYFFSSKHLPSDQIIADFDVCLISQWGSYMTSMEGVPDGWKNLRDAKIIMTEFVARYAKEHKIQVCVALRDEDHSGERAFYESHFGGRCIFQESRRSSFSSYKAVVSSRLSVALNSTLASEAFGAGLKILFVNPIGEEWLQPTNNAGPWYLSRPSYEAFSARMTYLLELSKEDYLTEAREEMRNVMSFNPDKPAHKVIRERLQQIINADA